MRTIRARYAGGVIEPLDAVGLPDNSNLTITLHDAEAPAVSDPGHGPFSEVAGSWVGLVDCDRLVADLAGARVRLSDRPAVDFSP